MWRLYGLELLMIGVLGSVNLDFVAAASRLPDQGQTVAGMTFKVSRVVKVLIKHSLAGTRGPRSSLRGASVTTSMPLVPFRTSALPAGTFP